MAVRLFALTFLTLACGQASHRRTLLIDQLPAHARRAQVFRTLRAGGWCPGTGLPGKEHFEKCDGTQGMTLSLTFDEDELVYAVFRTLYDRGGVAVRRGRRPLMGSDPVSGDAPSSSWGTDNTQIQGDRAEIRERVAEPSMSTSPPSARRVSRSAIDDALFSALEEELSLRFGRPERRDEWIPATGSIRRAEWKVPETGQVELTLIAPVKGPGVIVETWAFLPWTLRHAPTPRELAIREGRSVGHRVRSPLPHAMAAAIHHPCRGPSDCGSGWFCVKTRTTVQEVSPGRRWPPSVRRQGDRASGPGARRLVPLGGGAQARWPGSAHPRRARAWTM